VYFPTINRDRAERGFGIFYNASGTTVTAGYPVVLDTTATQVDGNRVTKPATAALSLFIGVAAELIATASYGKFQTYGYNQSVFVTNNTSVAVVAGDILVPVDAQWYLARSAAGTGTTGLIMAAAAVSTATTPAGASVKAFIRAL